jgi:hypothetical protein
VTETNESRFIRFYQLYAGSAPPRRPTPPSSAVHLYEVCGTANRSPRGQASGGTSTHQSTSACSVTARICTGVTTTSNQRSGSSSEPSRSPTSRTFSQLMRPKICLISVRNPFLGRGPEPHLVQMLTGLLVQTTKTGP